MKTVIEMAREAGVPIRSNWAEQELERFAELVRADERNSWPAEMEAMERQVNILTDALAEEREACAKVVDAKIEEVRLYSNELYLLQVAAAIRARSNT